MSMENIDAGSAPQELSEKFKELAVEKASNSKSASKPNDGLGKERKCGDCYIFDYQIFKSGRCRPGSEHDVKRLEYDFKSLNFDVYSNNLNLTKDETLGALKEAAGKDHSESKYFVCCFLTHGREGELLMSDENLEIDKILKIFSSSKCKTLSGKPKIFIFQACRGTCCEEGVPIDSTDFGSVPKNPDYKDFLVVYSTYNGKISFKTNNPNNCQGNHGSYFIDEFCRTLEQFSETLDLLQILTIVNYRIAYLYESKKTEDPKYRNKKQMPGFNSRLTSEVKFNKKINMFDSSHTQFFDYRRRQTTLGLKSTVKHLEDMKVYSIQKFKRIHFLFLTNTKDNSERDLNACISQLWSCVADRGCEREERRNWSVKELAGFLKEVSGRKFTDSDGLVCIITCKAKGEYLFDVKGNMISMKKIVEQFTGEKCPSLVQKPKIFIFLSNSPPKKYWFSCCSGDSTDSDSLLPVHADILEIAFTIQGSQELFGVTKKFCEIFETKSSEDFLSQLTRMNAELVKDHGFYSCTNNFATTFNLYSTLTKKLILNKPKSESN